MGEDVKAELPHRFARVDQVVVCVDVKHSPPLGSVQAVVVDGRRVEFTVDGGWSYGDGELVVYGTELRSAGAVEVQESTQVESELTPRVDESVESTALVNARRAMQEAAAAVDRAHYAGIDKSSFTARHDALCVEYWRLYRLEHPKRGSRDCD